jgi:hypothetical protein
MVRRRAGICRPEVSRSLFVDPQPSTVLSRSIVQGIRCIIVSTFSLLLVSDVAASTDSVYYVCLHLSIFPHLFSLSYAVRSVFLAQLTR